MSKKIAEIAKLINVQLFHTAFILRQKHTKISM